MAKREREKGEMGEINRLQEECRSFSKLEKLTKNLIETKGLRSLTFTMKGDKLCLLGSDVDVEGIRMLSETDPELLSTIMNPIKNILSAPSIQKKMGFTNTCKVRVPKLACQYKGRHWTELKLRGYSQIGLLNHGFGQGGGKSYSLEFLPVWWPDWINIDNYQGPTKATKEQNEAILENMYKFHNIDIFNYHKRSDSPVRTKKKAKVANEIEESVDKDEETEHLEDIENSNDTDDLGEEEEEAQRKRFFEMKNKRKNNKQLREEILSESSDESGVVTFNEKGSNNVSCSDTENEDNSENQSRKRKFGNS